MSTDTTRRPITASDLLTLRDIGSVGGGRGLAISPDGHHVAFELHQADLNANSYRVTWFVVPTMPTGALVQVGEGGDPTLFFMIGDDAVSTGGSWLSTPPRWSPDSQWIAYRRKDHDAVQLWRSRRDGRVQEQLTTGEADVEDFAWSADGSRIFFAVGPPRSVKRHAAKQNAEGGFLLDERITPYTSSAKPIWPCDVLKPEAAVAPWIYQGVFNPCPQAVWVYELATKRARLSTAKERAHYAALTQPPRLAPHPEARAVTYALGGKQVAWLAAAQPKQPGVLAPLTVFVSRSRGGRPAIACRASECTGRISDLWWSHDGHEIVFLRSEGVNFASKGLYSWSLDTQAVRTIVQTEDFLDNCSIVRQSAICFHEAAITPRKIISIDLKTGIMTTLVDPNAEFRHLLVSPATKLVWKNAFGEATLGHLVMPFDYEVGKRYPLIITTYLSRGFLRGAVGDEYPIQVFAANGFAVLSFEYPQGWQAQIAATSTTWEEVDRKVRAGAFDKRMILSSLEAAIDLLDERGIINPHAVGLSGLSYGAEITHYALFNSRRIAVAIASGPAWDPIQYYLTSIPGRRLLTQLLQLNDPQRTANSSWKALSLALNVERVRAPFLIQTADSEYLLTLQTFTALRDAGKPVELYIFPDEYHIKWQPKHRLAIYQRNLDWFSFWLRDIEDPDPTKTEQYRRWRELRRRHAADLQVSQREPAAPYTLEDIPREGARCYDAAISEPAPPR